MLISKGLPLAEALLIAPKGIEISELLKSFSQNFISF